MRKNRSLLFLLLVAVLTVTSLWSAGTPLSAEGSARDLPPGDGPWVVRAYYTDPQMVAAVASWTEPWEVNQDEGYVVVDVDRSGYLRLVDLGFRVEVDEALTKRLVQPPANLDGQTEAIPGYPCYRTVEETFATAAQIAADHPDLATWGDVGDSWEKYQPGGNAGYDMRVLRLTNANVLGPKPKLFVMAAIHAREYATAELVTRFAEYLVDNYDVDPDVTWLLDHHEIHLMLQSNPDGRKKAETGLSWRKNTNENYCGATSNSRGADLNRNYPFQWGCCGGSSGYPCDDTYRGPFANSEPETQAVVSYVNSEFPDRRNDDLVTPAPDDTMGIFLDIHSYSELVMWSWGFTSSPAPNSTQLQTLGRKFAYFNNYTPQQSMQLYATDGTTDDWAYGHLGIAAYCFEVGTSFFQDCGSFESTIYPDNLGALLYAAKTVRTPYITPGGPDALSVIATPGGALPGEPVALTALVDDTHYNNSNGTEPTQNINAAEYYIDVPPWMTTTTPVAYPMTAVDGSFNEKSEDVQATIDTSAVAAGRHIIYVRGQDTSGDWGPVSAQFLYILDPATSPVIQGEVLDAITGTPLAATVTAGPFQAHTDPATGLYAMTVISDTYDVTATATDYASQTAEDVVAHDGQTVQQDFALTPVCDVWADDVEAGTTGWTATGQWARTTGASHSPTHSWTDSPAGNYGNNWNYTLTAPAINLAGATGTTLNFWHQYDLESGYDYAYVEYSTNGGSTWTAAATYNGEQTLPAWEQVTIPLPALDGLANARIRFRIDTDSYITEDGWYLDDFEVRAAAPACATPLAPSAAFTSNSPVQLGDPVSFTNLTTGTLPISFHWDFGDGSGTSTEADPVYTYASPGTFVVTLLATNTVGSDSFTGTVTVLPGTCIPVTGVDLSLVTPEPLYVGQPIDLSAALTPADLGVPYHYRVEVDGAVVDSGTASANPLLFSHTVSTPGPHTVETAIWNCDMDEADALVDSLVFTVTQPCTEVQAVDVSLLSPTPIYVDEPVAFDAALAPVDLAAPYHYRVKVDGVETISATEVLNPLPFTHTFATTGTHAVEFAAWNCDLTAAGAVTDSLLISVIAPEQPCTQVQTVTLSLLTPNPLYVGDPVWFDVALEPASLALPYHYRVEVDGVTVVTETADANPLPFDYTFLTAGAHTVTVDVWNCDVDPLDAVTGSLVIDVLVKHRAYLPIVLK